MSLRPAHKSAGESPDSADLEPRPSGLASVVAAEWGGHRRAAWREYVEVACVIGALTVVGESLSVSYHTFGLIYLLAVIMLSLRVGRWPVLMAAALSALAWVFVFMPPRFSFAVLEGEDGLLLGTYVVVAWVAGELTSRLREQERQERMREKRATALFHLIRAIAEASTFDEALRASLRQIEVLFSAQTAILLATTTGKLEVHARSNCTLSPAELAAAGGVISRRTAAGKFSEHEPTLPKMLLPLLHGGKVYGVFVLELPKDVAEMSPMQEGIIEAFATQLALLVAREELRESLEREKLYAESDRLRRTLLDSVSHELKTPLAVLRSAGDKLDHADEAKRTQLTMEIRTAVRRLEHLVGNLLNQTRLESGALRPQLDWCDVHDVVNAARRAVGEGLSNRSFTVGIPSTMPLIRADAALLEQVLANLLLNACLHTPSGTPIFFSSGLEGVGGQARVFLRLEDRGPGIDEELRRGIFDKFHHGRNRSGGGLGLGLSIARGFVVAQKGEIVADNSPDGGARFTIYFPHYIHEAVPNDER